MTQQQQAPVDQQAAMLAVLLGRSKADTITAHPNPKLNLHPNPYPNPSPSPNPYPASAANALRLQRGIAVYRANAAALAERCLTASFPVLAQLVGFESFDPLARHFWQQHPPQRGDVAQWGAAPPEFLAAAPELANEPFLADVARVEWALHTASAAKDAVLGAPCCTADLRLQAWSTRLYQACLRLKWRQGIWPMACTRQRWCGDQVLNPACAVSARVKQRLFMPGFAASRLMPHFKQRVMPIQHLTSTRGLSRRCIVGWLSARLV